ncbi:hypothetical protein Gotri_026502 [Gossypium trilobum]|uniref:Uncharacterized protein n=1 Tax=Gossypium trilobum TaxID=34281 RepID=A0A7J9FP71_9ROSI|nr:hypothetical protein [Gossypium trilobum]
MASSNTSIPMDDVFNEYESALKHQKSTTSKDITQYTMTTQQSLRGGPSIKNYKFDADECRRAVSTFLKR